MASKKKWAGSIKPDHITGMEGWQEMWHNKAMQAECKGRVLVVFEVPEVHESKFIEKNEALLQVIDVL
jgi:hypothetical protein